MTNDNILVTSFIPIMPADLITVQGRKRRVFSKLLYDFIEPLCYSLINMIVPDAIRQYFAHAITS